MTRISAESNITIEVQPERWRMLANGAGAERVLLEASDAELRYAALFAVQRRLPEQGRISASHVQRVVTGWSAKDGAWHLGLMISNELAEPRGSRWVEIASWNDPTAQTQRAIAEEAGTSLATRLQRPFSLVPPKDQVNGAATAAAYAPSVTSAPAAPMQTPLPLTNVPAQPRPALPIRLERWTLTEIAPRVLELRLASSWRRSSLVRAIWNVLWAVVFIVLSYASLTSGIAPPQPEFLPYVGFGAAALLLITSIVSILRAGRRVNRYVIDGPRRQVIALNKNNIRWQMGLDQIQSIYVSEVVGKVSARKPQRTVHLAEINLALPEEKFRHLLTASHPDDKIKAVALGLANLPPEAMEQAVEQLNSELVTPLTNPLLVTKARSAAWLIADTLGIPAYYDQRIK
ncbi:hypothetical protein FBR02_08540 [Anaerolineae bacterium CFX9]|nr:hypothetical protein [Anaerolineae bacterium CFX9]